MSVDVHEPCHENGSTEHRAEIFFLFLSFLSPPPSDSDTIEYGKLQQAFGDDEM
jgi:hypothetical protein